MSERKSWMVVILFTVITLSLPLLAARMCSG